MRIKFSNFLPRRMSKVNLRQCKVDLVLFSSSKLMESSQKSHPCVVMRKSIERDKTNDKLFNISWSRLRPGGRLLSGRRRRRVWAENFSPFGVES